MTATWECGPTKWVEEYVDPFSDSNITREVNAPLPHVDGEVYNSHLRAQLLEVAIDGESILVNVRIMEHTWPDADPCVVYTSNAIIQKGGYVIFSSVNTDFSGTNPNCHKSPGDDLAWSWRVHCDDASYTTHLALLHVCDYADHTDPTPPIPGPGDPLLAAQYFDTTTFGHTGGCILKCITDNPLPGGGKNTVPTQVEWNLYAWDTNYATTVSATPLATDTLIIPSEKINSSYIEIPFFWDDLSPGEYLWSLRCIKGPHDGSFQLEYWDKPSAQKWPAWINGSPHDNFNSKILGIATNETWEKVINIDDSFNNYYYVGSNGHEHIKINSGDGYKSAMTTKKDSNLVCRGSGLLEGTNLSFETGDFTGWTSYGTANITVVVSTEWVSHGTYSAKFQNVGSCDSTDYRYLVPTLTSSSVGPGWKLIFDLNILVSSSNLEFKIYCSHAGGWSYIYTRSIAQQIYLNEEIILPSGTYYLGFLLNCTGYAPSAQTSVYLDNVRLTAPDIDRSVTLGRIVGGASNIEIV